MLNESNTEIDLILNLQKICQNRVYVLNNIITDNELLECFDSKNYVKSSITLSVSFTKISLSFLTLSCLPVTYLQDIKLNVAIKPFQDAINNYIPLSGILTVNDSSNVYTYTKTVTFTDDNSINIDLQITPKKFGLTTQDPSQVDHLVVTFTPSVDNIKLFEIILKKL
jgi:hypothetical protein